MTIRETTALILLYDACRDLHLRAQVRNLVPELNEATDLLPAEVPRAPRLVVDRNSI